MDKIIFLDIDGVLNSESWNQCHQEEIASGILIDEEKVSLLGNLVKKTNAKIVLHSGWKFWFDGNLNPLRKEAELLQKYLRNEQVLIQGVTKDFTTEEIRRTKRFSIVKAKEILAWVEENPEIKQWVVIDDLDLHSDEIAKHQIKTDANVGLSLNDVLQAEDMLLNS